MKAEALFMMAIAVLFGVLIHMTLRAERSLNFTPNEEVVASPYSRIDFDSLDRLLEEGECVGGGMEELRFTLYYCKGD